MDGTIFYEAARFWSAAGCNLRVSMVSPFPNSPFITSAIVQIRVIPWERIQFASGKDNKPIIISHYIMIMIYKNRDKLRTDMDNLTDLV